MTAPLESTLVRSLTEPELNRALGATITAVAAELDHADPALAARLRPMLGELTEPTEASGRPGVTTWFRPAP